MSLFTDAPFHTGRRFRSVDPTASSGTLARAWAERALHTHLVPEAQCRLHVLRNARQPLGAMPGATLHSERTPGAQSCGKRGPRRRQSARGLPHRSPDEAEARCRPRPGPSGQRARGAAAPCLPSGERKRCRCRFGGCAQLLVSK